MQGWIGHCSGHYFGLYSDSRANSNGTGKAVESYQNPNKIQPSCSPLQVAKLAYAWTFLPSMQIFTRKIKKLKVLDQILQDRSSRPASRRGQEKGSVSEEPEKKKKRLKKEKRKKEKSCSQRKPKSQGRSAEEKV